MKVKINTETTSIGKGSIFDIIWYSFFAVVFYAYSIVDFATGNTIFAIITLIVALMDTVVLVSNIQKRKLLKSKV